MRETSGQTANRAFILGFQLATGRTVTDYILPKKPRRRALPRPPKNPHIRILYDELIRQDPTDVEKFADWCGFSRQTIWAWLNELDYPRASSRKRLLERTGINIPPKKRRRR